MTLKFHTMGNLVVLKCSLQVPDIFSLDLGFVFEKSKYNEGVAGVLTLVGICDISYVGITSVIITFIKSYSAPRSIL